MDFRDTPEEAAFRAEMRTWLAEHTPREPLPEDDDERQHFLEEWHRTMYRAGWIGLSYPPEAGGRGLPESYDAILNEEMAAARAPPPRAIGHPPPALAPFRAPAPTWPRSPPGPSRTTTACGASPATRSGRARRAGPTGAWPSCAPTPRR